MFNEFEISQKEKAFNYSKLRFEQIDNFYTNKTNNFKDDFPFYSYIFLTISRFINYKEDIWKKNKKTKNISTLFSRDILDDFIFNGKFTNTKIDIRETRKKQSFNYEPIHFFDILSSKEKDSIWIIDNIRDSIAHGHFYIDFENEKLIIKNNQKERILHCSIDLELFFVINEIITEERIGGYSDKKLTTIPILYINQSLDKPLLTTITNESQLRYLLKHEFIVSYCKVLNIYETDVNKKYEDLSNFYNFNVRLMEKITNKFNGAKNKDISHEYIKCIESYIENKMQNYDIELNVSHLDSETTEKIIKYIKEDQNFYTRKLKDQGMIIHEILKTIIPNEEITLERGVMDFVDLYSRYGLIYIEKNKKLIKELEELIFINTISFKENKKLANLFILATNNFLCNKESIYDQYFNDYNEFNINNFDYKDYSYYNRLVKNLKTIENDILIADKSLTKAFNSKTKANNNLLNAPDDRKPIIENNINSLKTLINELEEKKKNLILQKKNIINIINTHKTDKHGDYLNNNNKSFFNHLRNAFAHNHISYLDNNIVYNRKIVLEDYDDENNLTFSCIGRYYDFVKLFNNDLFLQAFNNDSKKIKTLSK